MVMLFWLVTMAAVSMAAGVSSTQPAAATSRSSERVWRVMAVGDSITAGAGGGEFACYRPLLAKKLTEAGVRFDFVGTRESEGTRHEGYGGKNAEFLAGTVPAHFREHPADLVLLHAGHNYFAEDRPIPKILEATERLIVSFRATNPGVTVLLARVISSGKLPKYGYIPELNAKLSELGARLHTREQPVIVVDQAAGFDWESDTIADRVHPNARGAEKIARVWFEAIRRVTGEAR